MKNNQQAYNKSLPISFGLYFLTVVIVLLSCNDNQEKDSSAPQPIVMDTVPQPEKFFPILGFLKGEITIVDSTPVGIKIYTTSALANDSGYIDNKEFHRLANEFLPDVLEDSVFRREFRETSFMDNAGSATFYYNTTNPGIALKRVDVVTERTDTYDRVKSIYLEKNYREGKNIITKKLYWRAGRNFQIITQKQTSDDTETELIKVVWDNGE